MANTSRTRRTHYRPFIATWQFAAGFISVWAVAGLLVWLGS
jgi:predicted metal-binding membrane protein